MLSTPDAGTVLMIAQPKLGVSSKEHPAVVLEVAGAKVTFNFITSSFVSKRSNKMLFRSGIDLPFYMHQIDKHEWKASGLTVDCYLIKGQRHEIEAKDLDARIIGELKGALITKVESWAGVTIASKTHFSKLLNQAVANPSSKKKHPGGSSSPQAKP